MSFGKGINIEFKISFFPLFQTAFYLVWWVMNLIQFWFGAFGQAIEPVQLNSAQGNYDEYLLQFWKDLWKITLEDINSLSETSY